GLRDPFHHVLPGASHAGQDLQDHRARRGVGGVRPAAHPQRGHESVQEPEGPRLVRDGGRARSREGRQGRPVPGDRQGRRPDPEREGAGRRVMTTGLAGKALTVLGPVEADTMGLTLPHEHLLIDFAVMFKEPPAASDKGLAYQPVTLSNVGWVRQNFNANLDNLRLLDEQTALDEITLFRRAGGQTVIDPTNVSLSRDPLALTRISRATGLNIVMGAGYYVAAAHP